MRGGPPVDRLDVDWRHRMIKQPVLVHPAIPLCSLQHELRSVLDHAKAPAGLLVRLAGPEWQRLEQRAEAEADIRMPACAFGVDTQHQMAARPHRAGRRAGAHAREQQIDLRAERLERSLQQQVLLEAVATPALGDELSLEVLELERDGQATLRIEVLKRDRRVVGPVYLRKGRAGAQAERREVCVEVDHPRSVGWAAAKIWRLFESPFL